MGRVLLAALPAGSLDAYYESVHLQRYTEHSIGSLEALKNEVSLARNQGWSMVSQELENGLRGVAVPIWCGDEAVGAVNVSLQTHRSSQDVIEQTVVPLLQETARDIGLDYQGRPARRLGGMDVLRPAMAGATAVHGHRS
jgi:IclR family pca regulon transcriptional regulator